jgi:hypothetical protein
MRCVEGTVVRERMAQRSGQDNVFRIMCLTR